MKKLLLLLPAFLLFAYTIKDSGISKKEKRFATDYLEQTRTELQNLVKDLSEDQFNYKPAADQWSVKECLQHISITEDGLWKWCEGVINAAANPEKRAEIKNTDDQVIKMISDRSNKVKTGAEMVPEKSIHTTAIDALNAFNASRTKLIKQVKSTKADLRNHVTETPMGVVDSYQLILFIGAHTSRHTQQIAEVLADPNFPKK